MDKYRITFDTWNKIATLYEDRFMDLDLYNDTYDFFCKLIEKKNANILEIGCGPGNITRYILSKRPDFRIKGTDIAPNMIALAKKNVPDADFELMDCRNIDQLNTKFDGIVAGFCLPYLSAADCKKLIVDCSNLLDDKGTFYLSFMEGNYSDSGYLSASTGDKTYFYFHSLDILNIQLAENDFSVLNVSRKNYTKADGKEEIHTILIAQKQVVSR